MLDFMSEISVTSKEIEKVVNAIEYIETKTNILAMNAAIESARAGVVGRGFAVVANEVRDLSIESSNRAQNVSELIDASFQAINSGMLAAKEVAQNVLEIKEEISENSKDIKEVSIMTAGQLIALEEIIKGTERINQVVLKNADASMENTKLSKEVDKQATVPVDTVSK